MRVLAFLALLAGSAAQDGALIELDGEALSVAIRQPRAAQIRRRVIAPIARRRSATRKAAAHRETADDKLTSISALANKSNTRRLGHDEPVQVLLGGRLHLHGARQARRPHHVPSGRLVDGPVRVRVEIKLRAPHAIDATLSP